MAAGTWWAVYYPGTIGQANSQKSTIVQAGSASAAQQAASQTLGVDAGVLVALGPEATQAAAQARLAAAHIGGYTPNLVKDATNAIKNTVTSAIPNFSLDVHGISGWFFRGLKVLFGGILMIIGISKLTGVDNKITQLASRIPVVPV